jgi:hypothetical protein
MCISTFVSIERRRAVRTMVMTAGVSSRGGLLMSLVEVDIAKSILAFSERDCGCQGCSARAHPEPWRASDFVIANTNSYTTPANRQLHGDHYFSTPPHTHFSSFKSSSDAQQQSCLAPQTVRERW